MSTVDHSTSKRGLAFALELIANAPTSALDDLVVAICARVYAVDETELGHPSQVERCARLLRALGTSVHLAPIACDALTTAQLRALLVFALDRFAIDASAADAAAVATAADRYLAAVREPAISGIVRRHAR